jgi:hypothetical protein
MTKDRLALKSSKGMALPSPSLELVDPDAHERDLYELEGFRT